MKNVLITGCNRGLGLAMAQDLAGRQCNVIPHYRIQGNTANKLGTAASVIGDIRHSHTRIKIVAALEDYNIDTFINNAAIYASKPFSDYSEDEIIDLININLTSQILMLQKVYKHFMQQNTGLIININSVAGIQPAPLETIYAATKHGLKGFSQSLQVESLKSNVKIIDIFPGAMKTDMALGRKNENDLIDPNEIAKTVGDLVVNENATSLCTELVIRKFICAT